MSQLSAIVDSYKTRHGNPSDASVARAMGVAPQTLSSWRQDGIRELPDVATLRALARLADVPYERVVLRAALRDAGYLEAPVFQDDMCDFSSTSVAHLVALRDRK